ncbi:MAG: pilus assembly protein PilM [Oligoflexales bacterium]|nr:pilus assembly protein PilM [Oligoflexales bacterium]
MQRIIGLDIGSYSIKIVEIYNHFKSYEIAGFYQTVIPSIENMPADALIPACLEQIFKENHIVADRIITAMPGQYISSRIMPFGFSDPSKVEAAVFAEIEDQVPFNLSDMIVDHQILGTMNEKTIALVVMTKKEFLKSFLDYLQKIKIDPKLVDIDSLSFYNLCPYLEMDPGRCYGIVDIGHEKTSVCLVQSGILRMFRSINLGGRYITEFLARDLEISFTEAQRLKHRVSMVLTDQSSGIELSKEDRVVADRITVASNAIVKELGRTLYAFKNWEKAPVEKIFLSGGTTLLKNFDVYLTQQLEVQSVYNQPGNTLKMDPALNASFPIMAQGLAIGLRAVTSVKRHSQINMRKGEFAYVQDYEAVLKVAGTVFKIIAVALLLFSFSYMVKYFIYQRETQNVQTFYNKEVESFPELKKRLKSNKSTFDKFHKDSMAYLQESIQANRQASEQFISGNKSSGALVSLEQLSKSVPKNVSVEVVEYKFADKPDGTGLLRLRIEADSFDTLSKFKESLKSVSSFTDVVEKSSDSKPGTDIKIAVIEITYSPKL